ncbi:MAG: RluA family pseudouridine synthase [Hominenteromicrobium sp.]
MTRALRFEIAPAQNGTDIRTFVRRTLGFSARVLTALKYEGEMLLNGTPAHSNARLQTGDRLTLTLFDKPGQYEPTDVPLCILDENEDFLVIDKPADMPVHPSPGHDRDSVLNAAAGYFRNTSDFVFRPLYRLDRDTTGALVLAKNKFAACAAIQKTYIAVCEGTAPDTGRIDVPIGLKPGHKVERCTGTGDPACTVFQTLCTDGTHSLVAFRLLTGRTHQIRVHMASIGHPVAGDDLYGGHKDFADRQMLCCSAVRIICPALGTDKTVTADFSDLQKARFPGLFHTKIPLPAFSGLLAEEQNYSTSV